jgi:inosine/xanthosine triphosphatase
MFGQDETAGLRPSLHLPEGLRSVDPNEMRGAQARMAEQPYHAVLPGGLASRVSLRPPLAQAKFSSGLRIPRGMLASFPLESARPFVVFMKNIIIAVGSTRKPKLSAVMKALDAFAPKLVPDGDFEVVGVEVESGVSPTPSSCEELMRGARKRVEALVRLARETSKPWRYFVGLEGGLEVLQDDRSRRVFLESWAYACDGTRGFYGRSGGIELPEELAHEVLERGFELSDAIDHFAGAVGIRDGQGAWGVLSGDLIQRDESFRVAVITAFAPFYNARMYGRAVRTAS